MDAIQSESYIETHRARSFFIPSLADIILYLLVGALLLGSYNFKSILNWFGSNYLISGESIKPTIHVLNSNFSHSFSTAFGGRLGQVIFWSLVGAAAYIGLWFTKNLIYSFENDVIIDRYLHPSSYNRAGYWGSAFAGKMFFGAMVILLIGYLYVSLKVVMPAAALLARSATGHFRLPTDLLYLLLAVLISAFLVYAGWLMVRLVRRLWGLL